MAEKTKEELRKEFIEKHGIGCETCDLNPVNHGQRATCSFDRWPSDVGYSKDSVMCGREEVGYSMYRVATRIYSIDVPYCC